MRLAFAGYADISASAKIEYRVARYDKSACVEHLLLRGINSTVLLIQYLSDPKNAERGHERFEGAPVRCLVQGLARSGSRGGELKPSDIQRLLDTRGLNAIGTLFGDFSFAYYSESAKQLILYRSSTGTQPLYFRVALPVISFSPDPRRLLSGWPTSVSDIDPDGLAALLSRGITPADYTMYRGVRQVPPGWALIGDNGSARLVQLSALTINSQKWTLDSAAEAFRDAVQQSVRVYADGESKPALLFSGGLDSSILALELVKLGLEPRLIHWVFRSPHFRIEQDGARATARRFGAELIELDVSDALSSPNTYFTQDSDHRMLEPYRPGTISSIVASIEQVLAMGGSTLMTGVFGDELFASDPLDIAWVSGLSMLRPSVSLSPWRVPAGVWHMLATEPWSGRSSGLQFLRSIRGPARSAIGLHAQRALRAPSWLTHGMHKRVRELGEEWSESVARTLPALGPRRTAIATYVNILLSLQRPVAPAPATDLLWDAGIGMVHPYIDRDLVELCLSFSPAEKIGTEQANQVNKRVARWAYRDLLPEATRRVLQPNYALLAQTMARNNKATLRRALGPTSILAQIGVIEPGRLEEEFNDSHRFMSKAWEIVYAYDIERMLQLASEPSNDQ